MNTAHLFFILCQLASGAYAVQHGMPVWAVIAGALIPWAYTFLSPVGGWLREVAAEQPSQRWPDLPILMARVLSPLHTVFVLLFLVVSPIVMARLLVSWVE